MDMSPTYVGYKFRSLALANCPIKSNLSRLVLKLWDTCSYRSPGFSKRRQRQTSQKPRG